MYQLLAPPTVGRMIVRWTSIERARGGAEMPDTRQPLSVPQAIPAHSWRAKRGALAATPSLSFPAALASLRASMARG